MKPKAENRITGTLGEGVGCVSIEGLEMLVRKWGIWIFPQEHRKKAQWSPKKSPRP